MQPADPLTAGASLVCRVPEVDVVVGAVEAETQAAAGAEGCQRHCRKELQGGSNRVTLAIAYSARAPSCLMSSYSSQLSGRKRRACEC